MKLIKGFNVLKGLYFLNLIIELDVFNMMLTLNDCQQSFDGSIIGDYINFNVCFCGLNFTC